MVAAAPFHLITQHRFGQGVSSPCCVVVHEQCNYNFHDDHQRLWLCALMTRLAHFLFPCIGNKTKNSTKPHTQSSVFHSKSGKLGKPIYEYTVALCGEVHCTWDVPVIRHTYCCLPRFPSTQDSCCNEFWVLNPIPLTPCLIGQLHSSTALVSLPLALHLLSSN
mgnify:CR=1 FL=1